MTTSTADRDAVNHWNNYGGFDLAWACDRSSEFCTRCGRQMVETVEPGWQRDSKTGAPTFARYHSCPTWVTGWRTGKLARGWATPGRGHDSHDADNPMSSRGYA